MEFRLIFSISFHSKFDTKTCRFQFGDDTLSPGIVEELQKYYDNTDSFQDRAKCLELITAVNLGETVKENALQRPHSAMPIVGELAAPLLVTCRC